MAHEGVWLTCTFWVGARGPKTLHFFGGGLVAQERVFVSLLGFLVGALCPKKEASAGVLVVAFVPRRFFLAVLRNIRNKVLVVCTEWCKDKGRVRGRGPATGLGLGPGHFL